MRNSDREDIMGLSAGTFFVTLALILAFVVGTFIVLAVQPAWLGMEREAVEQSQQYVTTQRSRLQTLARHYEDPEATVGQRAATLAEMCEISDTIPKSEIPRSVGRFFEQHPCP